jgi:peroxiredoxin
MFTIGRIAGAACWVVAGIGVVLVLIQNRDLKLIALARAITIQQLQSGALLSGGGNRFHVNFEPREMVVLNGDFLSTYGSCPAGEEKIEQRRFSPNSCLSALNLVRNRLLQNVSCSRPSMFVFFSPADCPECLKEVREWNALATEGVAVMGIVANVSEAEARLFVRSLKIAFPVVHDRSGVLLEGCALKMLPVKVLLTPGGEVAMVSQSGQRPKDHQLFRSLVLALVRSTFPVLGATSQLLPEPVHHQLKEKLNDYTRSASQGSQHEGSN